MNYLTASRIDWNEMNYPAAVWNDLSARMKHCLDKLSANIKNWLKLIL